ncbi:uncharacterized protein BXZ73DRAFT_97900 [Epithele typhae]|uniref:uncharacterized protein n=1 Tax=Epithele typhae TaxID=378194 RepID=UPI002008465C|nr:uncharacterized protein BXZ73DRAFT_97900 [Epithele typhae]KAH9942490.1 hypothetical protein BXZ73DRAFT_97900 [Epithele typhae]
MSNPPTLADAPFDQPSADIVLRSADHVDFRAHRVILAQASPFFADMFSLPQASPPDASALPVVDMSEDSKTLRRLLLLCYPVDKQELDSVADIAPVLAAARKFDMEWPIRLLARDLADSISRSPLRAWSCACRSGLEEVARLAAEEIKRRVSSSVAEEEVPGPGIALLSVLRAALEEEGLTDVLQGVSGGAYFRLREYVRNASPSFSIGPGCGESTSSAPSNTLVGAPPLKTIRPVFLPPYPPPDAMILCSDGVLVDAHEVIIALRLPGIFVANPAPSLNGSVVRPVTEGDDVLEAPPPQQGTYTLDAPSTALVDILALCYRGKSDAAHGTDIDGLACVLVASAKSPMNAQMLNAPRELWAKCVEIDPLGAYFAAARRGLGEDDIRAAARKALELPLLGLYAEQLEGVDAIAYERLLKYHHDASVAVLRVLTHVEAEFSKKLPFQNVNEVTVPGRLMKDAMRKLSLGQHAPAMTMEVMGIDQSALTEAALQHAQCGHYFSKSVGYYDLLRQGLKKVESALQPGIHNALNASRLAQ